MSEGQVEGEYMRYFSITMIDAMTEVSYKGKEFLAYDSRGLASIMAEQRLGGRSRKLKFPS